MKIHDITRTVSEELLAYPGDPVTEIKRVSDAANGDQFTLSSITMSSHAGTHVDAPFHFIREGTTVDNLSLATLIGETTVIGLEGSARIDARDLDSCGIPNKTKRLLIKTLRPALPNQTSAYLGKDAARWVVERGIILLGVDSLSVDCWHGGSLVAHQLLLQSGVVILESLDLSEVEPGVYTMICLPLKIKDGDGAPARVILLEDFKL